MDTKSGGLTMENVAQLENGPHLKRQRNSTTTRTSMSTDPNVVASLRRMSRIEMPAVSGGRRLSTFSRASISLRQGSLRTDNYQQYSAQLKKQNTYKLRPEADETFNSSQIKKIMEGVLENYLQAETYDATMCSHLCQSLSDIIKTRVKDLNLPRYKIVCLVTIGQNNQQGLKISSRCLWDTETDNYACATYTNPSLFAVATVYGTYFE